MRVTLYHQFKNDEQCLLMISKDIYPYSYISSYEKLNDKQLPPIDCFFDDLFVCPLVGLLVASLFVGWFVGC